MQFSFGFDIGVQEVTLPEYNFMAELHTSELPGHLSGEPEMRRALAEPIGSPRLRACAKSGDRVVIISTLEKGDPVLPSVMPGILDELYTGGVRRKDITLLLPYAGEFGLDDPELVKLVGERTVREIIISSCDLENTVPVSAGEDIAPVQMNKVAAEADLRVLIGNIRYDHFLGFTGGSETLISACCPFSARNALLSSKEAAGTVSYTGSCAARDRYDAVAQAVGRHFLIDLIRGTDDAIKGVCAGDLVDAHREGIRYLNAMCLKMLPCPADIVIVSPGGAPNDDTLLEALPALDHARNAIRKDGTIVFIASCKNGFGSEKLESILAPALTLDELLSLPEDVDPEVRAACSVIALTEQKCNVLFVSEQMDPLFDKVFPDSFAHAQPALEKALADAPKNALTLCMPYGLHTVPVLTGK